LERIIGEPALLSAFSHLEPFPSAALAVSGGPDSMALMHLARRWLTLTGRGTRQIAVVTVDHRLRPEGGDEAAFVASRASGLGFSHVTLAWEGEKPRTGLQAAARKARYDLMTAYCRAHDFPCLVTAHTEDDQAETFLMRLRRGSGIDGLAAMAVCSERDGVIIVRPLLGISKGMLLAYLRAHAIPFVRDPSNDNVLFERVRLRHAMKAFASAGITRSALARAASRLGESRDALAQITDDFIETQFRVGALGQGEIAREAFHALPAAIALRVVSRVLTLVSGKQEPPRLMRIERLLKDLGREKREATLGGCLIIAARGTLYFYREQGRMRPEPLACEPSASAIWDGRFLLTFASDVASVGEVRQLGAEGWVFYRRALKRQRSVIAANRLAALATPALWADGRLVCAPALDFVNAEVADPAKPPVTARLAPGLARFIHRT
jgi:tRNA(Ile)-lysidine synthase